MRMNSFCGRWLTGVVMLIATAGLGQAQQEKRTPNQGQTSYNAIVDNLDMIVDNYVKFLGRKYELTEEQYQFTVQLVRERAYGFLEKHEPEVRDALERMFEVRAGGSIQQQELIDWGKKVMPLYNEAKKIITQSNNEWRSILTDDQKKKHDADLKEMDQSFKMTDDQMSRIVGGQMTPEEFAHPGQPPKQTAAAPPPPPPKPALQPKVVTNTPQGSVTTTLPPQPVAPQPPGQGQGEEHPEQIQPEGEPEGEYTPENQPHVITPPGQNPGPVNPPGAAGPINQPNRPLPGEPAAPHNEGEWDRYVREFIERFKLNDQQQQQATLKLNECKEKADQLRAAKKSEQEAIEKKIATVNASNSKDKVKEVAELNKQKEKLSEPINKIFEQQLKPALEKLPTRAQRKDAEAAAAKKSGAVKPGATGSRPSVPPASRPAPPAPKSESPGSGD